MYPIPVNVIADSLDFAAIGISAMAAIATILAVAVAVWQTHRAQRDANAARAEAMLARREATRLQSEATKQQERHHQAILKIEADATERARILRLDAAAREAARLSGADKVRVELELGTHGFDPTLLDPADAERMARQVSIGFFNGTDQAIRIGMRINDRWVELRNDGLGDSEREVLVKSQKWKRHLVIPEPEQLQAGVEVDIFFTDPLGNQWRIDQLSRLHLTSFRLVEIEDASFR